LLDDGVVLEKNVYNLPKNLVNANSKVEFHKKTDKLDFVPKTVFTKSEAEGLKFPIIAKPAGGSKGEGIKVFKTKEELNSSEDKFDVFSEKFDLKREFRVISIKGDLVFIAERIPENDKANSLRESEEETKQHQYKDIFDREGTLSGRSSYKWVKVEYGKDGIPSEAEFKKICSSINESLSLEFLGVDIGLDEKGKIWCIEANTCPGLNKDQIVLIYISLFKDFYKREPNEYTMKSLKQYQDELMRSNEDPAKFSFAPHQGNRFYYYDDKVNHETGDRQGRALLTTKYNIEKSFGDTMLNIKKKYESRLMDFKAFVLNENETTKPDAEKVIDDFLSGKLKPTQVSPKDPKDKTKFMLTEPDEKEGGDVNEEAEIYLPNNESLFINFSWSYSYKEGQKSGDRDVPDDAGEYILESLEIESVNFYYNNGEDEEKVELTPAIENKLKNYFEQFIMVSDQSYSYAKEAKKRSV